MKTKDVKKVLFFWAEMQRTLYFANKMPASHCEALNAIPGWSWELTKDKALADACWAIVEHDPRTCDLYIG